MKNPIRLLGYSAGALVAGFLVYMACGGKQISLSNGPDGGFTRAELAIMNAADSIMRVLTIEDPQDSAILRAACCDFSDKALVSDEFARL